MSHHGDALDSEFWQQYFNQSDKKYDDDSHLKKTKEKFGATGEFPAGKLNEQDEGGILFGITVHEGKLIMNFGEKPISWIGFTKEEVIDLIKYLNNKVSELK